MSVNWQCMLFKAHFGAKKVEIIILYGEQKEESLLKSAKLIT